MLKTTFFIFSNLRKLSEVFGNLRKCSEIGKTFKTIFRQVLKIFENLRKCSEMLRKLRKTLENFQMYRRFTKFSVYNIPISDTCGIMSLFCSYWLYIAMFFNSNKLLCFVVTINNAVSSYSSISETIVSWKTKTAKMKLT